MTTNNTTVCARHLIDLVPSQCDWSDEPFCPDCDTEQSFSDLYKDEVGCRPDISTYTIEQMREWVNAHTTAPKEDTMYAHRTDITIDAGFHMTGHCIVCRTSNTVVCLKDRYPAIEAFLCTGECTNEFFAATEEKESKMTKAELQEEIDAMVEELRGLNDPMVPCQFCVKGYIAAYKHVADGICFNCDGTGMERSMPLPADMARCKGCDHAFASGLIWGAEDAEVCPDCFEQAMGYERWGPNGRWSEGRAEHIVCGMVSIKPATDCMDCHEIAGQQGEDW
jgi:hypothetical protein